MRAGFLWGILTGAAVAAALAWGVSGLVDRQAPSSPAPGALPPPPASDAAEAPTGDTAQAAADRRGRHSGEPSGADAPNSERAGAPVPDRLTAAAGVEPTDEAPARPEEAPPQAASPDPQEGPDRLAAASPEAPAAAATAPEGSVATGDDGRPETAAGRHETETGRAAGPRPPRFDVVRTNADGETVVAGTAEPGQKVDVLLDGSVVESVRADRSGKFVVVLAAAVSDQPRELRLRVAAPAIADREAPAAAPADRPGRERAGAPSDGPDGTGTVAGADSRIARADPPGTGAQADRTAPDPLSEQAPPNPPEMAGLATPSRPEPPASATGAGAAPPMAPRTATAPGTDGAAPSFSGVPPGRAAPTLPSGPAGPAPREPGRAPDPATLPPESAAPAAAAPGRPSTESAPAIDPAPDRLRVSPETAVSRPATPPGAPPADEGEVAARTSAPATAARPAADPDVAPANTLAGASAPERASPPDTRAGTPARLSEPAASAARPEAPAPVAEADTAFAAADERYVLSEPVIILPPRRPDSAPALVQPQRDELAMLQPEGSDAPGVVLDQLTYDADGSVVLRGRASDGHAVRLYGDGRMLETAPVRDGEWRIELAPEGARDLHLFRLDEVGTSGRVTSRVETPFDYTGTRPQVMRDRDVIVQRGDNLWTIAEQVYGEGIRYSLIYGANSDLIRDPDLIYPDQVFTIPELVEAE